MQHALENFVYLEVMDITYYYIAKDKNKDLHNTQSSIFGHNNILSNCKPNCKLHIFPKNKNLTELRRTETSTINKH